MESFLLYPNAKLYMAYNELDLFGDNFNWCRPIILKVTINSVSKIPMVLLVIK